MHVSIFEIVMLLCFAASWPFSIVKALRTKVVIGKSPVFDHHYYWLHLRHYSQNRLLPWRLGGISLSS